MHQGLDKNELKYLQSRRLFFEITGEKTSNFLKRKKKFKDGLQLLGISGPWLPFHERFEKNLMLMLIFVFFFFFFSFVMYLKTDVSVNVLPFTPPFSEIPATIQPCSVGASIKNSMCDVAKSKFQDSRHPFLNS